MQRTAAALCLALVAPLLPPAALAQPAAWPDHPVRVVVAYPPGGTTDFAGRQIAQKLGELTGKSFYVDNRAGASGQIGTDFVVKSAPDGGTLLLDDTTYAMLPHLYKKLPWDPAGDLVQVTSVLTTPLLVVVGASSPYRTLQDLVDAVHQNPGKLTFGSGGVGSGTHLAGELLKQSAHLDLTHVPYKGASEAMLGVVSGQVDVLVTPPPTALGQITGGKARALAVTGSARLAALPQVPTSAEAGQPDLLITHWFGLAVPKGTPTAIIERLQQEAQKALAAPDLARRIADQGGVPGGMPTADFQRFVRRQTETWGQVIRGAGIQPE